MQTRNLTPRIGTEVTCDRAALLDGSLGSQLRALLEERGVLVFPQVHFDNADQERFAATLGTVIQERTGAVTKVSLDKKETSSADYIRGAFYWHIDGAGDDVPALATVLTAKVLSETGGHTEFANTYAAYDDLDDATKAEIEGLKAWHSLETSQRYITPEPGYAELLRWQQREPKLHPIVWTHRSGRKSLVLGSHASHVEGMSPEEGRALLCKLREFATRPEYVVRHEWTIGDMVVWDNTGTMHRVTEYAIDSGRLMHRSTLVGEEALV